jgi:hypothetical protein
LTAAAPPEATTRNSPGFVRVNGTFDMAKFLRRFAGFAHVVVSDGNAPNQQHDGYSFTAFTNPVKWIEVQVDGARMYGQAMNVLKALNYHVVAQRGFMMVYL